MYNLIELYNSGYSISDIVRKTGIPKHVVIRKLNKDGLNLSRRILISDELIKEEYILNKLNACEIARKYNINNSSVYYRICKMGIAKSRSEIMRSDEIKHSFFYCPNQTNSYWAGFIAADGSVIRTKLSFKLHKKDIQTINNFSKIIGFKNKLTFDRDSVGVCFGSEEICRDLKDNFNIVPCKSLILKPPHICEDVFVQSFIRGYFDGDGYICKTDYKIGFAGTEPMLNWIKENLFKFCNINNNKIVKRINISEISWSGLNQTSRILKWLYTNSTPETRLARKHNIFLDKYNIFLDKYVRRDNGQEGN